MVGLAIFALTGCGGGAEQKAQASCSTSGKQVTFPLLDRSKTYTVGVVTNFGRFDVRLDARDSPCTTSSFAALLRQGFFDGTRFHRIVPGFVIQGGDPTATGQGGPGYTVRDVPPGNAAYTKGVVAMAKTESKPPGTSGSQFFRRHRSGCGAAAGLRSSRRRHEGPWCRRTNRQARQSGESAANTQGRGAANDRHAVT
jgi:peptidyl-prolyl cis-trans isomerase B (cyclophilin B)